MPARLSAILAELAFVEAQSAADNLFHDLACAGKNAGHARIRVHSADPKFVHIAGTAMKLDPGVRHPPFGLSGEKLRFGCDLGCKRAAIVEEDALIDERLDRVNFCSHSGKSEAGVLEGSKRATERLSFLHVIERDIEGYLSGSNRTDCCDQPLSGQEAREVAKAL